MIPLFRDRLISIIICIIIAGSNLHSQKILDFDNLSIDDGFTSSKAISIIQDSKGFIWIGTWNGLNRYDGYECEIFKPSFHDSTTISNREVSALLEDHAGRIWIGTTSGLNCLDPATGMIRRYEFQQRILSLFEDREQVIWVGTWNGGLFKLDPETGSQQNYLGTDIVSDIFEDSRNTFWIATYNGLINFDRNTSGYIRYLPDDTRAESSISHSILTQIVESDDGNLWIGTWGGGLNKAVIHPNMDSLQFFHYSAEDYGRALNSDAIYRLYYDDFGNLWIGTWDMGLNMLAPDQQGLPPGKARFSSYVSDLSNQFSISGNNITALFVDRSGMLWVGSSKIDRTSILETGMNRYNTTQYTGNGYYTNSVRSLAIDDRILLVGTTEELMLYEHPGNRYILKKKIPAIQYNYNQTTFTSSSILSILINDAGLWLGTDDAGLIHFPDRSAITEADPGYTFYNTDTPLALPGNKVTRVIQSFKNPDIIWIGTQQSGLASFNYKDPGAGIQILGAGMDERSVSDNSIRSLAEDHDGFLWIGTQNGLNCYDPESGLVKKYFASQTEVNSINDNVINIIFEDSSDNLWIGTNMGLNRKELLVLADGTEHTYFRGYPGIQYLSDEIILNILEDDEKKLWIGLYRGMIRFDEISETVESDYFNKEYQRTMIQSNSAAKDAHGNLLFGGSKGFITFHPDSLLKQSVKPKVCITDLLIFNESVENMDEPEIKYQADQDIPYENSVDLTYRDRVFTFVFSAMDYKDPVKNEYAYMLDGFDDGWNEVGSRNTATYTNIRPGKYTFMVRAANSDGIWSEEPTILEISIAPPWWKTSVAFIFYALIIIGILYFFNRYTLIEAREKGRIALEHLQLEKEQELNELKSRFFTNITHEFRTPLTLILGPAEELLKIPELSKSAKRQAELIQRNAQRMLRLINQLMEFRKAEKEKLEIFPSQQDISAMLNDLYESFQGLANSKGIEFKLSRSSSKIMAMVDYEKFEKALFNIVSNAFKYSEEGGQITIRAGTEYGKNGERLLVIEVEDTGIGIAEENKDKVFDRFFQVNQKQSQSTGGIGLFLSKSFIELHGGTIELDSEPGKGSIFRMVMPADRAGVEPATGSTGLKDQEEKADKDGEMPTTDQPVILSNNQDSRKLPAVLIVEDDSEMNEFLVSGLSSDFRVTGAFNGREALEIAKKTDQDIIITDIMMPEMDGIELCRQLRDDLSTCHIPVIFLTAKAMPEDEIAGLKMGAVDYIYKPFNLQALKLKIHNIREQRENMQDNYRTSQLLEPEHIELASLDEKFLREAVETVNKFLDDHSFDVDKFSHELGVSPNQVYRKIKALTGQTAKEFIRNQRLKTAADMLLQKKRSISEIIYMVGFTSPSYFTKCFKEYYGSTPKEYIEKNGII